MSFLVSGSERRQLGGLCETILSEFAPLVISAVFPTV